MKNNEIDETEKIFIPKGFRLTKATRENVVIAAAKSKFRNEAEDIINTEAQLLHCISEEVYPREFRQRCVTRLNLYPGVDIQSDRIFEFCRKINFNIKSLENNKHCSKRHKNLLIDYVVEHNSIWTLGIETSYWSEGNYYSTALGIYGTRLIKDHRQSIIHKETGLWWTQGIFEPAPSMIIELLSDNLQKALLDFFVKTYEFRNKIEKFKNLIESVLNSYTSAVKLVETHPEFESWIWKSLGIAEQASCTDIPSADAMQEVRSLLQEA